MCGRYEYGTDEPDAFLEALLKDARKAARLLNKGEICPGALAAVAIAGGSEPHLNEMCLAEPEKLSMFDRL